MLLESTLSMPSATIHASHQLRMQCSVSTSTNLTQPPPQLLEPSELPHGANAEPRLPEDPFHGYEGPLTFGPGADWEMELPVHQRPDTDARSSAESLDADVEFTLLSLGLLDSPPLQAASPPPRVL
jgi:hypothetical protein